MTLPLNPAWVEPYYAPVYIPALPTLNLTDDELALISRLQVWQFRQREQMLLDEAYYQGSQVLTNLGIALPPELTTLRVIIGWPRIAVDPYVERLEIDSFRLATATKADQTLDDLRQEIDMAGEEVLAFTDALILGRSYFLVGSNRDGDPSGPPDLRVESPLNVATMYDYRTQKPSAALQSYWMDQRRYAALYLPDQTIYIAQDDDWTWQVVNRDQHNFGMVPVVRMSNRPRAATRDGASEITAELKSIVDATCRTLLNLTAASEFYSVPQKLILGATEEDFIGSDGAKKSAWETYIGRVLALQRDSEGALPEVKQFEAYNPAVFTQVIEMYASQAAGILAAPPQDLGLYTNGNPVTAEAMQVSEARRDRRTQRMQANFGRAEVEVAQMLLRFMNHGELPAGYERLAADWRDPQIVNFTGFADGISKLTTEGHIAQGSDVAMRKLGFNAVERRQMAEERANDPALELVEELATEVAAKAIRMANATAKAASPDPGTPGAPAPATPAAPTQAPSK